MSPRPRIIPCLAAALAIASGAGGCSSGRYDAELAGRLEEYRFASAFAALNPEATWLPGTRVGMRLPRQLLTPVAPEQVARLVPPFVADFPVRVATYEALLESNARRSPASLTVGVVPRGERQAADVEKAILDQVRADGSFGQVSFRKGVTVAPVAGGPSAWHVLSLRGEQLFESLVADNPESKRRPGICEIWVSAEPRQDMCVVLAIRVPEDVAGMLDQPPAVLAELVARSVEIAPANPQQAPAAP